MPPSERSAPRAAGDADLSAASHRRSDAQRNRRALLEAARELVAERGDVAFYEIARRARVGQATLYRHFPDRRALLGALAEEVLDELEAETERHGPAPDALEAFLACFVRSLLATRALVQLLAEESSSPPRPGSVLHEVAERLVAMVEVIVRRSAEAGRLRDGVGAADVMLVLGMLKGVVDATAPEERDAAAERALELALRGVLAPGC